MKNQSYLMAIVVAAMLGLNTTVQARGFGHGGGYGNHVPQHRFEQHVDRRQARQWDRITNGMDSGELSRGEAERLMRSQRRIAHMESRFERDGYVSPRERRKLERALNRTSKRIRRAKHNDLTARGHHRGLRGWRHRYYAEPYSYEEWDEAYVSDRSPGTLSMEFDDFNVSWSPAYQN